MSDSDELPAGGVDVLVDGAVGNDVIEQLRGQIQELRDRREDALANSAVGGGNSTRSYIYVLVNVRFNPFVGSTTKMGGLLKSLLRRWKGFYGPETRPGKNSWTLLFHF